MNAAGKIVAPGVTTEEIDALVGDIPDTVILDILVKFNYGFFEYCCID